MPELAATLHQFDRGGQGCKSGEFFSFCLILVIFQGCSFKGVYLDVGFLQYLPNLSAHKFKELIIGDIVNCNYYLVSNTVRKDLKV